jgi:hypothetical protein
MLRYEDVSQGYSEGRRARARCRRRRGAGGRGRRWHRPGLGRVTSQPCRCVSVGRRGRGSSRTRRAGARDHARDPSAGTLHFAEALHFSETRISWKLRFPWKLCIARKLFRLTACFISARRKVSTLTAVKAPTAASAPAARLPGASRSPGFNDTELTAGGRPAAVPRPPSFTVLYVRFVRSAGDRPRY